MVNPRTCQDVETGILKSESETKKCGDLIEKQICDRQTENQRFRDPLVGCARSRRWVEFAETSIFQRPFTTPKPGRALAKKF